MVKFNKGDVVYKLSHNNDACVVITKCVVQSWGAKTGTLTNETDGTFIKYRVYTDQVNKPVIDAAWGALLAGDWFFKADDVTRDFVESVAIENAQAIIDWNVRHYERCLSKVDASEGYRKAIRATYANMRRHPEIVWIA